ncbi:MAG: D-mannonate oxidoreductase [Chloroflexi bacterium]|nr:MAG: D-mannonate oxidoreductase [Chloroflexota bacterium]
MEKEIFRLFDLTGKVAVVTGGSGALGSAICKGLWEAGASVVILARRREKLEKAVQAISPQGERIAGISADVTSRESLERAAEEVLNRWGRVDILVNAAGGNMPAATTSPEQSFFDLTPEGLRKAVDLNLMGTILACQAFGKAMAEAGGGSIINISSMAASRPLTRVVAYSAAKAGVENFTRWLAVHMAQEYSPSIRVNAIAPGFFLSEQNRALLIDEKTGELTPRGKSIIAHTPMGRFGDPQDLIGTVLWLASSASAFITGIVVPVDGGFSAYSGV